MHIQNECKCNLRTYLFGEGCEICNPKFAEDIRIDNLLSLEINTKVMVTEDGKVWLRRYLHHTERSMVDRSQINAAVFPMGCDSWTFKNFDGNGMNPRLTVWTKWRLAEEGE